MCGRRMAATVATTPYTHARKVEKKVYSASPYLFNVDDAPLYNPFHLFSELSSTAAVCIPKFYISAKPITKYKKKKKI